MKKITLFLLLSMVIVFSAEAHKYKNKNSHVTISIQTFYDELSPYGDWMYTPEYGYVWLPYFEHPEAFRPYSSNGHWVNTDYGWTWVSGYRWGWATFHYGRWDFDNYLGWMWIPGYEWAPAWVTWGNYNDYYGWAPLGPNVNINVNFNWYAPDVWWTFVPRHRFCSNNWHNYIYDRPIRVKHITHITNIYTDDHDRNQNRSWYYGPRVSEVERYNNRVRKVEIVESNRADNTGIRRDRLNVYRPEVDNKRNDFRPGEYRNVEQVRRNSTSISTNPREINPGENPTRENRVVNRSRNQSTEQRNVNVSTPTRVEQRSSEPTPNSRSREVVREVRDNPRSTQQTEPRSNPVYRESRVESPTRSQVPERINTPQPSVEVRREKAEREVATPSTESNRSITRPTRVENTEIDRNNNATRVEVERSSTRESKTRQETTVQPNREERNTRVSVPVERKRESTEKSAEPQKSEERPARGSIGNPSRR